MGVPDRHDAAATLLKALANPYRVRIVDLLATEEHCVHDLVEALNVEQPLVSQHLRKLRENGIITARRQGREMVYSLADDHIAHIVRDAITHAAEPTSEIPPASSH